jgi:hypothetical protein
MIGVKLRPRLRPASGGREMQTRKGYGMRQNLLACRLARWKLPPKYGDPRPRSPSTKLDIWLLAVWIQKGALTRNSDILQSFGTLKRNAPFLPSWRSCGMRKVKAPPSGESIYRRTDGKRLQSARRNWALALRVVGPFVAVAPKPKSASLKVSKRL